MRARKIPRLLTWPVGWPYKSLCHYQGHARHSRANIFLYDSTTWKTEAARLGSLATVATHFGVSETSVGTAEDIASDVRALHAPAPQRQRGEL